METELFISTDSETQQKPLIARLYKWLWAARFFPTKERARAAIEHGKVLYQGSQVAPGTEIHVGDKVEILGRGRSRAIRIKQISTRRHNSEEACNLYEEIKRPSRFLGRNHRSSPEESRYNR